jgi:xylulokinase
MKQIITVDAGTTAIKTAVFDQSGKLLAKGQAAYPLQQPGSHVEQDPEDWWKGLRQALATIKAHMREQAIQAVVLGGQMQDLILLRNGEVMHPAILYMDTRAGAEIEEIESRVGRQRLISTSGNVQDGSSLPAKLLWLKKHLPEPYREADTLLLGAHDYLSFRMTGAGNTDYTTASTTGLMELRHRRWARRLLGELDIRDDWLPRLVRADHRDGTLDSGAASFLGLPAGVPVLHGSGDVGSATVGAGAGEPGPTYCYLGTSGWVAESTDNGSSSESLANPEAGIYNLCHPDPSRLIHVGPMLSAGGNLDWALKTISSFSERADRYALLEQAAAAVPAGSNGVLYCPWIAGERAPFKDPQARACFIGLSRSTGPEQLYRAVLEGVALSMRSIREAMPGKSASTGALILVGGGARSCLWSQIFADVFGCDVFTIQDEGDVGSKGSAIIGGKSLGWFSSYLSLGEVLRVRRQFKADPGRKDLYDKLYPVFRNAYPALKDLFSALSGCRTKT